MTFAKQWSDQQVHDLAEKCARKLQADRKLVFSVVDLLLGQYLGLLLKVLGSVGAHHGTPNCYFIWGCRCDPCSVEGEREEKRMAEQAERIARTRRKSA